MVIDDGDPCHADDSIERALEGFGVKIWDWKRLDLSTEVICKSTMVVEEICLYSSGNQAVLMGWASQDGLPDKKKFPCVSYETNWMYCRLNIAIAQESESFHP